MPFAMMGTALPMSEKHGSVHRKMARRKGCAMKWTLALSLIVLAASAQLAAAQQYPTEEPIGDYRHTGPLLDAPALLQEPHVPPVQFPQPTQSERTLPINLATALYLSQARPLIIASAQASVEKAAAQLQGANALWLPDLSIGASYSHHDGANQGTEGNMEFVSFGSYGAGAGATLNLGVTDALFQPLAARQQLSARQFDLQAAQNDALLSVAQSYFDVQEARGRLAGVLFRSPRRKNSSNKSNRWPRGWCRRWKSIALGLCWPI